MKIDHCMGLSELSQVGAIKENTIVGKHNEPFKFDDGNTYQAECKKSACLTPDVESGPITTRFRAIPQDLMPTAQFFPLRLALYNALSARLMMVSAESSRLNAVTPILTVTER